MRTLYARIGCLDVVMGMCAILVGLSNLGQGSVGFAYADFVLGSLMVATGLVLIGLSFRSALATQQPKVGETDP